VSSLQLADGLLRDTLAPREEPGLSAATFEKTRRVGAKLATRNRRRVEALEGMA
jgi:hypothetical protein